MKLTGSWRTLSVVGVTGFFSVTALLSGSGLAVSSGTEETPATAGELDGLILQHSYLEQIAASSPERTAPTALEDVTGLPYRYTASGSYASVPTIGHPELLSFQQEVQYLQAYASEQVSADISAQGALAIGLSSVLWQPDLVGADHAGDDANGASADTSGGGTDGQDETAAQGHNTVSSEAELDPDAVKTAFAHASAAERAALTTVYELEDHLGFLQQTLAGHLSDDTFTTHLRQAELHFDRAHTLSLLDPDVTGKAAGLFPVAQILDPELREQTLLDAQSDLVKGYAQLYAAADSQRRSICLHWWKQAYRDYIEFGGTQLPLAGITLES